MPQLTIEEIDEETLRRLEARARQRERSVEAEAREILEQATASDDLVHRELEAFVEWTAALRRRSGGRHRSDVTADIRADRDR